MFPIDRVDAFVDAVVFFDEVVLLFEGAGEVASEVEERGCHDGMGSGWVVG